MQERLSDALGAADAPQSDDEAFEQVRARVQALISAARTLSDTCADLADALRPAVHDDPLVSGFGRLRAERTAALLDEAASAARGTLGLLHSAYGALDKRPRIGPPAPRSGATTWPDAFVEVPPRAFTVDDEAGTAMERRPAGRVPAALEGAPAPDAMATDPHGIPAITDAPDEVESGLGTPFDTDEPEASAEAGTTAEPVASAPAGTTAEPDASASTETTAEPDASAPAGTTAEPEASANTPGPETELETAEAEATEAGPETAEAQPETAEVRPETARAESEAAQAEPEAVPAEPEAVPAEPEAVPAEPQIAEPQIAEPAIAGTSAGTPVAEDQLVAVAAEPVSDEPPTPEHAAPEPVEAAAETTPEPTITENADIDVDEDPESLDGEGLRSWATFAPRPVRVEPPIEETALSVGAHTRADEPEADEPEAEEDTHTPADVDGEGLRSWAGPARSAALDGWMVVDPDDEDDRGHPIRERTVAAEARPVELLTVGLDDPDGPGWHGDTVSAEPRSLSLVPPVPDESSPLGDRLPDEDPWAAATPPAWAPAEADDLSGAATFARVAGPPTFASPADADAAPGPDAAAFGRPEDAASSTPGVAAFARPDSTGTFARPDSPSTFARPDSTDPVARPDGTSASARPGSTDPVARPDGTSAFARPGSADHVARPLNTDGSARRDSADAFARPDTTDAPSPRPDNAAAGFNRPGDTAGTDDAAGTGDAAGPDDAAGLAAFARPDDPAGIAAFARPDDAAGIAAFARPVWAAEPAPDAPVAGDGVTVFPIAAPEVTEAPAPPDALLDEPAGATIARQVEAARRHLQAALVVANGPSAPKLGALLTAVEQVLTAVTDLARETRGLLESGLADRTFPGEARFLCSPPWGEVTLVGRDAYGDDGATPAGLAKLLRALGYEAQSATSTGGVSGVQIRAERYAMQVALVEPAGGGRQRWSGALEWVDSTGANRTWAETLGPVELEDEELARRVDELLRRSIGSV